MNEKVCEIIKEMEKLVMDVHRYAGMLDNAILSFEMVGFDNPIMAKAFVETTHTYHKQATEIKFQDLKQREKELWDRLIKACEGT